VCITCGVRWNGTKGSGFRKQQIPAIMTIRSILCSCWFWTVCNKAILIKADWKAGAFGNLQQLLVAKSWKKPKQTGPRLSVQMFIYIWPAKTLFYIVYYTLVHTTFIVTVLEAFTLTFFVAAVLGKWKTTFPLAIFLEPPVVVFCLFQVFKTELNYIYIYIYINIIVIM
jgi:hypothetical protein